MSFLAQTVTDVALGVTQAGLSMYLNRRYGKFLPHLFGLTNLNSSKIITKKSLMQNFTGEGEKDRGKTEKNNNLPKNIRLRSTILMNLRPAVGIQVMEFIQILISTEDFLDFILKKVN